MSVATRLPPAPGMESPGMKAQRGNVMLAVMVIMALLMGMGATLVNHFMTSEAEAVDKSLSDIRAYWAMMGHVNYMLGRAGGQGLCDLSGINTAKTTACVGGESASGDVESSNPTFTNRAVTTRVGSMQYYLDGGTGTGEKTELNDASEGDTSNPTKDIRTPGYRWWYYPVDYFDSAAASGVNAGNKNRFGVQGIVRDITTVSAAAGNNDGRMRVDLTVAAAGTVPSIADLPDRFGRLTVGICVVDQDSTHTLNIPSSGCGVPPDPATAVSEGYSRIQYIQFNKPIPTTP